MVSPCRNIATPVSASTTTRNISPLVLPISTTSQHSRSVPLSSGSQVKCAVAERTGAQFYDAPSAAELGKVYADIGSKVGFRKERKDATHWPLGVGVALLVISAGLSLAWQQKLP